LREAQQRLRALITAPSQTGTQDREREVASLLCGDPQRSAAARLEIYAYAWFERLHGVLADDFAALARVLGEPAFRALVRAYLSAHPPSRPSLRDAGAKLPDFLRDSPAAAQTRGRVPFAPDLARLEWALLAAFDAADAPALPHAALAAVAPESWAELGFVFQPALQLLTLAFAVDRVRLAHDRGDAALASEVEPVPTCICVWRSNERVFQRTLDPIEAEALALARSGASFGRLCEAIAERLSDEQAPLRAASLLARWQQDGWLAALEQRDPGEVRVC
jgi:hypothetical protein